MGAMKYAIVYTLTAFLHAESEAVNWAQVSGNQDQNVIQSSVVGWSARWGHAVAIYDPPIVPEDGGSFGPEVNIDEVPSRDNVIYILGGDDYDENTRKGGYHNDIWRSEGQSYEALINKVTQVPKVVSRARWRLIWGDKIPPIGATYDEWLECFSRKWRGVPACRENDDPYTGDLRRWSPRRNHAAVHFLPTQATNNFLRGFNGMWVLGGRARAIDDIPVRESWGGVYPMDGEFSMDELKFMFHQASRGYDTVESSAEAHASAPLEGFSPPSNAQNRLYGSRYKLGRWREKTVLKNDVWASEDGIVWHLINPGCKYHEQGRPDQVGAPGTEGSVCDSANDCYGDSACVSESTGAEVIPGEGPGRCRCNMWSPRERHAVAVFEEQLVVSGGLTRLEHQRCGAHPCGGGYREWLDDVWVSLDGEYWEQLSGAGSRLDGQAMSPRGEHSLVVMHNMLFALGGRGRRLDRSYLVGKDDYLNDVWASRDGRRWQLVQRTAPWAPRSNFAAGVVADAGGEKLVIFGGQGRTEDGFRGLLDEAWWTRLVVPDFNESTTDPLEEVGSPGWRLDYSDEVGEDFRYPPGQYISPDSPVALLSNFTEAERDLMHKNHIERVWDLAQIGHEMVVAIRDQGFRDVCFHKMRAIAAVNKCTVKPIRYDGYFEVYQHVKLAGEMSNPYRGIRGITGTGISKSSAAISAYPPVLEDSDELPFGTDGCVQALDEDEAIPELENMEAWRASAEVGEVPELICRWNPGRRTEHTGVVFRNKFYIFGGKALGFNGEKHTEDELVLTPKFDVWFRDETQPVGEIITKPRDFSSDTLFTFACDEPTCVYEVQLLKFDCEDVDEPQCEGTTVFVPWRLSTSEADFADVLVSGRYVLQLRTYDAAGNIDISLYEGGNQYTWVYTPPLPVLAIVLSVLCLSAIAAAVFIELRRRRKKQAMERYALKRMRRKFKGMAKDANRKDAKMKRKKAGGTKKKKKKGNKVAPDTPGSPTKKKSKKKKAPKSPKKKK